MPNKLFVNTLPISICMLTKNFLTFEECAAIGGEFFMFVKLLKRYQLVFTGKEKEFKIVEKYSNNYTVEYTDKTFTYTFLDLSIIHSSSRVMNIQQPELKITFSGLSLTKTKALSYVFDIQKASHNLQPKSVQIAVLRLEKIVNQAKQFMNQAKLPVTSWVDLFAIMYCSVKRKQATRFSRFKDQKLHDIGDVLRYLKMGVTPPQILAAWERNINAHSYRDFGDLIEDIPEEILDAMFED